MRERGLPLHCREVGKFVAFDVDGDALSVTNIENGSW